MEKVTGTEGRVRVDDGDGVLVGVVVRDVVGIGIIITPDGNDHRYWSCS